MLKIPNTAYPMGFMAWRIGDILEFNQQMEWIQNAGFDAIGFHANPGISGIWRGVDPAVTGINERKLLRQKLSNFRMCEIHAPFELTLKTNEIHHNYAGIDRGYQICRRCWCVYSYHSR